MMICFAPCIMNMCLFSALGGILVMGLGIIISGVFILRVKPNARFVAAWIAFTAVIYSLGRVTHTNLYTGTREYRPL